MRWNQDISHRSCRIRQNRIGGARLGFTLVELLVVVAIIAILAAILMPALRKASVMARASLCGNNQRQIGFALMNYTGDYAEILPPVGQNLSDTATYVGTWSSRLCNLGAYSTKPGVYVPYSTASIWETWTKPRTSIFWCPEDMRDPAASPTPWPSNASGPDAGRGVSYYAWQDYGITGLSPSVNGSVMGQKLSQITRSGRSALIFDAWNATGGWNCYWRSSSPRNNFRFRHGGIARVMYADLHSSSMLSSDIPAAGTSSAPEYFYGFQAKAYGY